MKADGLEKIPLSNIDDSGVEEPTETIDSDSEIFFEAACLNRISDSEYQIILGSEVIKWAKSMDLREIPAIVKELNKERADLLSTKLNEYEQLDSPNRELVIIGDMSDTLTRQELEEIFPEKLVELHYYYQGQIIRFDEPEDKHDGNPIGNTYDKEEVVPTEINWDNRGQKEEIELVLKVTEGSSRPEKIHKWAMVFLGEETEYQTPKDVLGGGGNVRQEPEEEN